MQIIKFWTILGALLTCMGIFSMTSCDDDDTSNNTNDNNAINNSNNSHNSNNMNNNNNINNSNNETNNISPNCGNGVGEGAEICDGLDMGTATCITEGYDGGELSCNNTCDGFITEGCDVAGGDVGNACQTADECSFDGITGDCYQTFTAGPMGEVTFPDGYCSAPCNGDPDEDECAASGGECFENSSMGFDGMCFKVCTEASECRTGYDCSSIPGAASTYCLPPF